MTKRRGKLVYPRDPVLVERDAHFVLRYRAGETLQQIGDAFGVTGERVRQRLVALGLAAACGGVHRRVEALARDRGERAKALRAAKEEARARALYDCGAATVYAIGNTTKVLGHTNGRSSPILRAYHAQKKCAAIRGIGWAFTLETWWAAWQESGKWGQRGRGAGYCMARWADDGPYSPENCYICTNSENIRDSYITKPAAMRLAKRAQNKAQRAAQQGAA